MFSQPGATMADALVKFLLLFLTILPVISPVQWTQSLPDGHVVYACEGQDVQFPWAYTSGPGDVISSIKWTFDGHSQEMVAVLMDQTFLALPSFSHRVQHLPEAGITLSHVTVGDTGNYTVEITSHDGSSTSSTLRHTAFLQVSADLMTTDRTLHVQQGLVAEYSNTTDQFHVVLSCGHFTFSGDPPFAVQWVSPDGSLLSSTDYKDGYFRMFLTNPVVDGSNFTCQIPQQSLPASCSHGNAGKATLVVDGVQGRLAVIEARQSKTESVDHADIEHLKNQVSSLQTDNAHLKTQVSTLQEKVGFHATDIQNNRLNDGETIVFPSITTNIGGGYSSSTGVFTTPRSGLYFLAASTSPNSSDLKAYMKMVVDNVSNVVAYCYAYQVSDQFQTGTCHAVLSLQARQRVWMAAQRDGNNYWHSGQNCYFSGFLISAE